MLKTKIYLSVLLISLLNSLQPLEENEEEKIASAKRFLALGLSPEQVASGVDLSIEEVQKLVEWKEQFSYIYFQ